MRCTATLENPADPGVDPFPSAWLLPASASIILEPDAVQAINSQHLLFWSSSLEGAMLGWFSSRSRNIRKEVLLQGSACAPVYQSSHSSRGVVPTAALRGICRPMVGRHDKPRCKFNGARLMRVQGSAWIESASIKRICMSAAQVKERRQGSRTRAPCWWLAAAKPDFVLGSRLGINWTPAMRLHRHCARQRRRCVQTHAFVRASRFPGVHR